MTFAGIDYDSEAVHIVLVDEEHGNYVSEWKADLACGPGDAFARARRVKPLLPPHGWIEQYSVVAIGIELPFSRFAASLVPLMRVQGAVLACIPRAVPMYEIRTQTWKQETVAKSNATKLDVMRYAIAAGAPEGLDLDHYDAFCIARTTRATHARERGAAAA